MTFGSLFAGIGGFDLGFERAGFVPAWQVENNDFCVKVLRRRWPGVTRFENIQNLFPEDLDKVDVICGGDPCPKHSRARSNGHSRHPDLSGYFLAVVGRLRPEWVVRENVPAPTVEHFACALEALGYGAVVIRLDGSEITGQVRQRDFIVGKHKATRESVLRMFPNLEDGPGAYTTRLGTRAVVPALTTHRTRYDSRDCYVWEPETGTSGAGLRILDAEERAAFAGFPRDWLTGFSEAMCAKLYGNAVIPEQAEWIGRCLMHTERSRQKRPPRSQISQPQATGRTNL